MREGRQLGTDSLWRRYTEARQQNQRNDLVVRYSSLVNFVVCRMACGIPHNVEHADLVSHGVFGLIDAIEKFDPGRGYKFETYAIPRIKGAILDGLRSTDWVPRSLRAKARAVEWAYHDLEGSLRRSPTPVEVAAELGLSELALRKVLAQISVGGVVRLDDPPAGGRGGGGMAPAHTLADVDHGPDAALAIEETKWTLRRAIDGLADRERTVLVLYYFDGLRLAEIGTALGVTESRICQIHTRTLGKLRERLDPSERECA